MRILIIRPGAIGDTLLTFPIIQALRERHSPAHIALVANAAVLPLALQSGLVEEAYAFDELRWSELFASGGIQLPALREQLRASALAICWLRDPGGVVERNLRSAGVQRVLVAPGRPPAGERIHVVDYLARTTGLPASAAWHNFTLTTAMGSGGHPHPRVAIHPGSGGASKCWPAASFATLIAQLWQHSSEVLLVLGPAEHERWNMLQKLLPAPPGVGMLQLLASAPLVAVAEQLRACRCYLGNDAGITHLAAMLAMPTIALFGPSDPVIWRPLGPQVEIIQAQVLEKLPVSTVKESVVRYC